MMKINVNLLKQILKKYNIEINKYEHFQLALTHSSYANEHQLPSNERIEFLGDSILGYLVAEYIYEKFTDMPEGKMSKVRSAYVCEEANAGYARTMGIDKLLLLGHGEELSGGRKRNAVLGDAFECFLAAVYLTNGISDVKKILIQEVFPHIMADEEQPFVDYKSKLQEYVQGESRSELVYRVDTIEGPPHNRVFTISVYIDNIKYGTGIGRTKKQAEQEAAKSALNKMVA